MNDTTFDRAQAAHRPSPTAADNASNFARDAATSLLLATTMQGFADAPGLYLRKTGWQNHFVQQARAGRARFQLSQQNCEVIQAVPAVNTRGIQHEQQHTGALNVAQEQVAQPPVLVRALYDAGQVSHSQRLHVVVPGGYG